MASIMTELKFDRYGTVAQDIYDNCCDSFGWNKAERGKFGKQQLLYAENAVNKGLSVWFIANSDMAGNSDGKDFINILGMFADPIIEIYKTTSPSTVDMSNRVVFVKKENGYYYFIGVYKIEEQDDKKRIYKQISNIYPYKLNNE